MYARVFESLYIFRITTLLELGETQHVVSKRRHEAHL